VNKRAGMVVHPAAGNAEHTMVNALLHHCAGQLSGIGGVARPGIVHRLDKDTSGCLLVAKTDGAHNVLAAQFADRSIDKRYHAIVCGRTRFETGEIDAPIARHAVRRKEMAVTERGREARTGYRVLELMPRVTWIEATLHTGRTHQIRVHLQSIGHPLVGDKVYGLRQNARLREETGFAAPRQMLHASSLRFVHPTTHQTVEVRAPLPADLVAALAFFRESKAGLEL
jgi:23S rRNA pseudouridine1911/1915/1917 synthase